MKMILKLLASTLSVLIAAYLIPGVTVPDFKTALIVAVVLGILNLLVKPLLVILTLPITIITLGLFYLVINALIVIITAAIVPGFIISSFLSALLFSLVVSIVNYFLSSLVK